MRVKYAVVSVLAVAALALTGCSDNGTPRLEEKIVVAADEAAVALLPAELQGGTITVGVDPYYAPNEYKDEDGTIVGWEIDLADAIAQKLGVTFEYREMTFDSILPAVADGTVNLGFSSFTDNAERQQLVDFVNYYDAGIQWAQVVGGNVNPAKACGLTVAVQKGTYEETDELPAKSSACEDGGQAPITISSYETQDEATTALIVGQADAMSADSPITLNAVSLVRDQIEVAGEAFDVAPYGIAVAKDSGGLDKAIQKAIESLIADGNYEKVLEGWGVADGSRAEVTINAGA
jgi:polar amino acid transport system substrate-binding protein